LTVVDVAFEYAHMNPKLKAAYSFYGVAVDNPEDAAKVVCPVYGFYGENDERVNATIPKAEELMNAAGKKYGTGDLQRRWSRLHALGRTEQSECSRRRQKSAGRSLGEVEGIVKTVAGRFMTLI
jgi:dienelactone hydrolase